MRNTLIQSEAAAALTSLRPQLEGQVSLVYADPPYNTGVAWRSYADRQRPTDYVASLQAVFDAAVPLLAPHGSVWVSVDDRALHLVRQALDSALGAKSYVATCVWQKRYTRENRGAIGDAHEYIVVYAKDVRAFARRRNLLPVPEKTKGQYTQADARGPYQTITLAAQSLGGRPNQHYVIVGPDGTEHRPPPGRCWKMIEARFKELLAEGRISFGSNGRGKPRVIRYLDEVQGVVPWTWWPHEEVGHTQEAKYEQYALFGRGGGIDTPKPERLLARVVSIASCPGDWVVDPFAGSGTMGAVAHKLGRQWVCVDRSPDAIAWCTQRLTAVSQRTATAGIAYAVEREDGFDVK